MSAVPLQSLAELERALARAKRAMRSHLARCAVGQAALACERCNAYGRAIANAAARLEAAASQRPERTIGVGAAEQRRDERVRQEAAA